MTTAVTTLDKDESFKALIEHCQSALTEASFNARQFFINSYHEIGGLINEYVEEYKVSANQVTQQVAEKLSVSQRTLQYAVQFFQMFPDLDTLPEGKDISWRKIVRKYLNGSAQDEGGESKDASFQKKQSLGSPSLPYLEWLRDQPCCVCGKRPVEPAHYPRTRGAGAKEDEALPMCHPCHRVSHDIGFVSFFEIYGKNIFENFIYPLIRRVFNGQGKMEMDSIHNGGGADTHSTVSCNGNAELQD